jgi:hypothetical protein
VQDVHSLVSVTEGRSLLPVSFQYLGMSPLTKPLRQSSGSETCVHPVSVRFVEMFSVHPSRDRHSSKVADTEPLSQFGVLLMSKSPMRQRFSLVTGFLPVQSARANCSKDRRTMMLKRGNEAILSRGNRMCFLPIS